MTRLILVAALALLCSCGSSQDNARPDAFCDCLSNSIKITEAFWKQDAQMQDLFTMLKECMGEPMDTAFMNARIRTRADGLSNLVEQKALFERLCGK